MSDDLESEIEFLIKACAAILVVGTGLPAAVYFLASPMVGQGTATLAAMASSLAGAAGVGYLLLTRPRVYGEPVNSRS